MIFTGYCFRLVAVVFVILLGLIVSIQYIAKQHNNGLTEVMQQLSHTQRQLKETKLNINKHQVYPEQLVTPPIQLNSKGFVVIEQLNQPTKEAILSLLIFQCWATKNKLELIQPSVSAANDIIQTDLFEDIPETLMPLSKVYYMDKWNGVFLDAVASMNEMILMTETVLYDTRTALIVDIGHNYNNDNTVNENRCMIDSDEYRLKLAQLKGIIVTREICFNSDKSSNEILIELSKLIATQHEKSITIIRHWPNRSNREQNSLLQLLHCGIIGYETLIKYNTTITTTTTNHIQEQAMKYIKSQFSNNSFVAIALTSDILKSKSFSRCLEQVLRNIQWLSEKDSNLKFFIALFESSHESSIAKLIPFKLFFRSIYWTSYSIEQWQGDINYYSNTMGLEEKVQLLQIIASRAACLILAGDGKIVHDILNTYNENLSGSNYDCLFTITECNRLTMTKSM